MEPHSFGISRPPSCHLDQHAYAVTKVRGLATMLEKEMQVSMRLATPTEVVGNNQRDDNFERVHHGRKDEVKSRSNLGYIDSNPSIIPLTPYAIRTYVAPCVLLTIHAPTYLACDSLITGFPRFAECTCCRLRPPPELHSSVLSTSDSFIPAPMVSGTLPHLDINGVYRAG
jgi:hypothetical protein